jgi:hypothetical protein
MKIIITATTKVNPANRIKSVCNYPVVMQQLQLPKLFDRDKKDEQDTTI